MNERRTKIPYPTPSSPMVEAIDVPVKESTERWTEVQLEDGTVLRLKPSVLAAVRVDNQYDPDGNPAYSVKTQIQMIVASAPDALRKKNPDSQKVQ